ncbi:MAG: ATP-binding protein [Leeuwenhoekiella sp.]
MQCTAINLQEIPDLSGVPLDQLEWLFERSVHMEIAVGDKVFSKGDPIDELIILVRGRVEIRLEQAGNYRLAGTIEEMGISGLLPFSRASTALGYGEVVKAGECLRFPEKHFREMISQKYELTEALVHVMSTRVRDFAKRNLQQEKMMALGKLSAGLAHELNNPASAMVRSADALKKHFALVPEKFKRIMQMQVNPKTVDLISDILFKNLNQRAINKMSLLERNDKEDELEEWLGDHHVEHAYDYTETLIDFCMDIADLQVIYDACEPRDFQAIVEWIVQMLTTDSMVHEIEEAASRVSGLVASIKGYTHMDRGSEREPVDIHEGIESTLTMLNHQRKQKNISVIKDFDHDLNPIPLFVSQINQVWTNLLDNAIDAVDQDGKITIITSEENNNIQIEIKDNGSGIDPDKLSQIFDPFYSTKPIGKGTGMGLEVVQRIINGHNGTIEVKSKPGETTFTVCLPYKSD